jgi:hypothetical protein
MFKHSAKFGTYSLKNKKMVTKFVNLASPIFLRLRELRHLALILLQTV